VQLKTRQGRELLLQPLGEAHVAGAACVPGAHCREFFVPAPHLCHRWQHAVRSYFIALRVWPGPWNKYERVPPGA